MSCCKKWKILSLGVLGWSQVQDSSFAFTANIGGTNFDRFKAKCPADISVIAKFDPDLVKDCHDEDTAWVAVFRANNNLPSVLAQDDFFKNMDLAIKGASSLTNNDASVVSRSHAGIMGIETKVSENTPVAVARLRRSELNEKQWVLDTLRCSLKKERINKDCDGGSEHTEALSVCIDELIVHHLRHPSKRNFEQTIRCKATLVSSPLLESRGFTQVEELCRDMATHISSLEGALEKYAERASAVGSVVWNSPSISDRTLQIVSLLARLDHQDEKENNVQSSFIGSNDNDDGPTDPWANLKRYL